jgi:hypothetical protein
MGFTQWQTVNHLLSEILDWNNPRISGFQYVLGSKILDWSHKVQYIHWMHNLSYWCIWMKKVIKIQFFFTIRCIIFRCYLECVLGDKFSWKKYVTKSSIYQYRIWKRIWTNKIVNYIIFTYFNWNMLRVSIIFSFIV